MSSQLPENRLDEATAQRLGKLRAMPVDTSHLDLRIADEIPRRRVRTPLLRRRGWLRAVAASLGAVLILGAVMWSLSGGPVMASADMMAQFHSDMVSGQAGATPVTSIAEANQKLKHQWDHGVDLPRVPAEHVMMCCMRSIQDKRVACVLLQSEGGVPVTMCVARSMDMRIPPSERVVRGGLEFHVVPGVRGLTMVTTERGGKWICLIGATSSDRLIDIGSGIEF
jgi:hypothetical protein